MDVDITDITTSPAELVAEVVSELTSTQGPAIVLPSEEVAAGVTAEESRESVSIMRAITNLWADRSAALWKPLEYPLYGTIQTLLKVVNRRRICSQIRMLLLGKMSPVH